MIYTTPTPLKGAKSVEVRPVGVSKGLAMERVLAAMVELNGIQAVAYDYVLVAGHFLTRDENVFTLFEGRVRGEGLPPSPSDDLVRGVLDQFSNASISAAGGSTKTRPSGKPLERKLAGGSGNALAGLYPGCGRGEGSGGGGNGGDMGGGNNSALPAMRLPPKYLYTCTVGRGQSQAKYFLNSSSDVAELLSKMC